MCVCTIMKIIGIIWLVSLPFIPFVQAYYVGKTGENLFTHCDDDNKLCLLFWPIALVWAIGDKILKCIAAHCSKLYKHIEELGRNSNDK